MRKLTAIFFISIMLLFVVAMGCKEQAGQATGAKKAVPKQVFEIKCGPDTVTCDSSTKIETTTIYELGKTCTITPTTKTCPNGCDVNTNRCAV